MKLQIASSVGRLGDRWWIGLGLLGARWRATEIDDSLVMLRLAVRQAGPEERNRSTLREAGL